MSIYSIWPAFACTALILLLAGTPLFAAADSPPTPGAARVSTLDGLRGFLALGVFFHHAAITHAYVTDGVWRLPPSRFYAMAGQVTVALFFMITGYLFWSILIRERGRPDWSLLYNSRLWRIGPLYLVAIASMLLIVSIEAGGQLRVPIRDLVAEIAPWLCLGSLDGGPVNGVTNTGIILAGVTWTLRYEWLFYAGLIVISLAARSLRTHLPFAVIGIAACLLWRFAQLPTWLSSNDPIYAGLFFAGMVSASLRANGHCARLPQSVLSAAALSLLILAFVLFPTAYAAAPTVLIGMAFYLIISGATIFGLLETRAARRLGNISYGIYLLQGLVLTAVFAFIPVREFALASASSYWEVVTIVAVLLVVAATFAHVYVERVGIEIGRSVGQSLRVRMRAAPMRA